MSKFKEFLPSALLIAYIIYSTFIPVTVAHSLIIIALVVLFGLHIHISRQEIHKSYKQELDQMKNELEEKIDYVKKSHEQKLLKLEDEVGKTQLSLAGVRNPTPSQDPKPRKVTW